MQLILPEILTLKQYLCKQCEQSADLRPQSCCFCGMAGLHRHATYERHSDRENKGKDSLNPILIQRYICPNCRKLARYYLSAYRLDVGILGSFNKRFYWPACSESR